MEGFLFDIICAYASRKGLYRLYSLNSYTYGRFNKILSTYKDNNVSYNKILNIPKNFADAYKILNFTRDQIQAFTKLEFHKFPEYDTKCKLSSKTMHYYAGAVTSIFNNRFLDVFKKENRVDLSTGFVKNQKIEKYIKKCGWCSDYIPSLKETCFSIYAKNTINFCCYDCLFEFVKINTVDNKIKKDEWRKNQQIITNQRKVKYIKNINTNLFESDDYINKESLLKMLISYKINEENKPCLCRKCVILKTLHTCKICNEDITNNHYTEHYLTHDDILELLITDEESTFESPQNEFVFMMDGNYDTYYNYHPSYLNFRNSHGNYIQSFYRLIIDLYYTNENHYFESKLDRIKSRLMKPSQQNNQDDIQFYDEF